MIGFSKFSHVVFHSTFWQLGEVAEIEAKMFRFVQKFNQGTTVEFSTKPAILPSCSLYAVFFDEII